MWKIPTKPWFLSSLFDILRPIRKVEGGPGGEMPSGAMWADPPLRLDWGWNSKRNPGTPGVFCGVFPGKSDVCPWFSMMFTIQRHTKTDFWPFKKKQPISWQTFYHRKTYVSSIHVHLQISLPFCRRRGTLLAHQLHSPAGSWWILLDTLWLCQNSYWNGPLK